VYSAALVWTAVEEGLVLSIPSTGVAAAWAQLHEKDRPVLEVLLHLPVAVIDDLTAARARTVGWVGGELLEAHALLCARDRGWPLVTSNATRYVGTDLAGVDLEQLP
jgi:hypothetical protein